MGHWVQRKRTEDEMQQAPLPGASGFHRISKSIPTWLFPPCHCSLSPNVTSLEELSMIPTAKSTSLLPISLPP